MQLENLIATPHPAGHRIVLTWANPDPVGFPGVRVVRRADRHPAAPDDGVLVAEGTELAQGTDAQGWAHYRVEDAGLKGETTYYYSLFPYGDATPFDIDRANRSAALAGAAHGLGGRMFELLPAIYHRYDADLTVHNPEGLPAEDEDKGPLQRLLEVTGGQLDLLQSYARALLDLYDPERVDGRLLPLLAQWIGWKTDFRREIDTQRNEVSNAPGLYQRVGMLPVVGATVKRISGWESRSKEFVHNVVCSNRPARLNLWGRRLDTGEVPPPPATLLSLDFAYEGRPAAARDDHGIRWFFYHTLRRGRWRLWFKTSPTFRLGRDVLPHLETPDVAALQQAFAAVGVSLAADATVAAAGSLWHVDDPTNAQTYVVEEGADALTVYHTSADPLAMAPSRPLNPAGDPAHEKDPAAAQQSDTLWVFWSAYDAEAGRWEIRLRTRRDGTWSAVQPFTHGAADPATERKAPAAAVDQDGGLWLFWLERDGPRWQLRYNRHDGTGLDTDPMTGWQLDPPAVFPLDGTDDPRVEADVFVLSHPEDANRRLWVFWARKEATADPVQTRWTVAYRVKAGLDPAVSDWSAVETLPKDDEDTHDREPAARVDGAGVLTVYWSADRAGSWSVWRATLDPDAAPPWGAAEELTAPPYAQRDPLALPAEGGPVLLYRSNESLTYASDVYRATETVDFRYAGATTVPTRNTAELALRGAFDDFQTYTYDTGPGGERTNDDWYSRDTLGVYVRPDTLVPDTLARGLERLSKVLPEFMPATDRAVLITQPDVHAEYVYTYGRPDADAPHFITERYTDVLTEPEGSEPAPD